MLKEVINDLKIQGSENFKQYEIELHKRTSKCFGIVLLFGQCRAVEKPGYAGLIRYHPFDVAGGLIRCICSADNFGTFLSFCT